MCHLLFHNAAAIMRAHNILQRVDSLPPLAEIICIHEHLISALDLAMEILDPFRRILQVYVMIHV